jgi:hypothetical protein
MNWFYITVVALLSILVASQFFWIWYVIKTQKEHHRMHDAPTMWDVRNVLMNGDKDLAVQLYCEVFDIDDIDRARKEVDELERSIRGKV